jgi:hypothetical protein
LFVCVCEIAKIKSGSIPRLRPLAVEQWGPFVFCHLGGGGEGGEAAGDVVDDEAEDDRVPPLPNVAEWLGEGGRRMAAAVGLYTSNAADP